MKYSLPSVSSSYHYILTPPPSSSSAASRAAAAAGVCALGVRFKGELPTCAAAWRGPNESSQLSFDVSFEQFLAGWPRHTGERVRVTLGREGGRRREGISPELTNKPTVSCDLPLWTNNARGGYTSAARAVLGPGADNPKWSGRVANIYTVRPAWQRAVSRQRRGTTGDDRSLPRASAKGIVHMLLRCSFGYGISGVEEYAKDLQCCTHELSGCEKAPMVD